MWAFSACNDQTKTEKVISSYPTTKKVDTVDTYFGIDVPDPYRWLEDDLSTETAGCVDEQNKVTFSYLNGIPFRGKIKERLSDLYDYKRVSAPFREGKYIYFTKNDGLQNQSVIYRKLNEEDQGEVFLDPNTFSDNGTISLAGRSFSKDGSLLAYQISEGGSDWRKVIVMDTESKAIVGDTLFDVKFSGLSWKGNDGFFYSSYDKPEEGSALSAKTQYHKLYYHRLGTPQSDDRLIFGGERQPNRYIFAGVSTDERFLLISASTSTSGNKLFVKDIEKPDSKIVTVIDHYNSNTSFVANEGDRLILKTDLDAPKGRVVEVNFSDPVPGNWKDLIPEIKDVLTVSTGGGRIFATYLEDAKSKVLQYDLKGNLEREVK